MAYLSDLLVAAAALGAAFYCFILSRRLQALSRLDGGLGSAIALLSAQVDDLSHALSAARSNADRGATALDAQIARAEAACGRLDLLLASLHDLPGDEIRGDEAPLPGRQGRGASVGADAAADADDPGMMGNTAPAPDTPDRGVQPARHVGNVAATRATAGATRANAPRARIVRRRQTSERV